MTVLIDTFNHQRFIECAVSSVLEQDFPPSEMEILVVDDGSTDGTPDLLARFAPRLRLLRKPNGGQASAFNFGIPEARGQVIAFLDGDDWWAPRKLMHVAAAMRREPRVGLIGHGIIEVHDRLSGKPREDDGDIRTIQGDFAFDEREESHFLREDSVFAPTRLTARFSFACEKVFWVPAGWPFVLSSHAHYCRFRKL